MRKLFVFLLIAVLTASLVFAGGTSEATAEKKVHVVIGSVLNPGSPENVAMQWILDTLSEKTNGRITGALYEAGSIGSEAEMLEQCINGDCHITVTSLVGINKYARAYNTLSVPYLYSSKEEMLKSWNGPIGEAIRTNFEKNGLYYDGIIFRGNRQLTANFKITDPSQLKGLKLRLPETVQWVTVWGGMGAICTPTSAAETFSALQNGVVDAQENNITSNQKKGMEQVQKYTMMTNHIIDTYIFTWSKTWFDSLSEADQKLIRETILEAADYGTKITEEGEAKCRAIMEAGGMEFIEVDASKFKEAALSFLEKVASSWEDWVLPQALKDME